MTRLTLAQRIALDVTAQMHVTCHKPTPCTACGVQMLEGQHRLDALPSPNYYSNDITLPPIHRCQALCCTACATSPERAAERVNRLWLFGLGKRGMARLRSEPMVARILRRQCGVEEVGEAAA